MKTFIVNFFAGPGAGKSTMAAGLFNKMKEYNWNVEYVQEFAKQLTWEKNFAALHHQPYVTGTQMYLQNMLLGQVDAVITDSPIIIGLMYLNNAGFSGGIKSAKPFYDFVVASFKHQNNINFFIERSKIYNPVGRSQSEDEAKVIDDRLKKFLKLNDIPFTCVSGDSDGLHQASEEVLFQISEAKDIDEQPSDSKS